MPSAVAAAERVPITLADSGSARSSTGASVVLKPKAFTPCAISSPCRRARPAFPVRRSASATACAECMAVSASRSRSTVPPSMSTQRKLLAAHRLVASASRARVCRASAMLRRKRITPAGRTSLSHARSRPVSSVPSSPTTRRLPTAWRRFVFITAPSSYFQQHFQPEFSFPSPYFLVPIP